MEQKVITVDFDGVVIEKIFGRDWMSQSKKVKRKPTTVSMALETCWANINHLWRKPIKGSLEGIKKIKESGYKVVLVTSRKKCLREVTLKWMKKWGFYDLYDDFYFNDKLIGGADSKVENLKKIKPEWHIDDNIETIEQINTHLKEIKTVHLDEGMSWSEVTKKLDF